MFQEQKVLFRFRGFLGVDVEVGSSLIILGFIFVGIGGGTNLIWSVSIFALLVLSIYLHELGHAWGCRVQKVPVRRIMIYGGGGFCEQSRSATLHQQEFIVAMGPIVNLVLWAFASLATWHLGRSFATSPLSANLIWAYPYLLFLAQINLALAAFNMLPLQPLDGGKILHLVLLRFLSAPTAQRVTGGVGFVAAILWFPALFLFFFTTGWILFFFPSVRVHWAMMRGPVRRK